MLSNILSKLRYKGVVMAAISGVLGVLIAMNVITPEQQATIMENAEYILGMLVAVGVFRTGKDVKDHKQKPQ